MRILIVGSLLMAGQFAAFCPPALSQDTKPSEQILHLLSGPVMLAALSIERGTSYPSVIHLKGNVEIKVKTVVRQDPFSLMIMEVHADEADYHEGTGEIEARGKVHVDYRDDPNMPGAVGNIRIKLEPLANPN